MSRSGSSGRSSRSHKQLRSPLLQDASGEDSSSAVASPSAQARSSASPAAYGTLASDEDDGGDDDDGKAHTRITFCQPQQVLVAPLLAVNAPRSGEDKGDEHEADGDDDPHTWRSMELSSSSFADNGSRSGTASDRTGLVGYMSRAKARTSVRLRVCRCGRGKGAEGLLSFHACMLFLVSLLTFGCYFSYDAPGALETQLTKWFNRGSDGGSYTHASNSLLYAAYTWPNCVLSFLGGFILDRVTGIRRGTLLFCGLVLLGQVLFQIGCLQRMLWLAVLGRAIFGLGGENLTVAQQTYTVRWFDGGRQLALAFGLVVSFSRIGTALTFVLAPKIVAAGSSGEDANDAGGIPAALWVASATCAMSMVACFGAAWADRWGETQVETRRAAFVATLTDKQQERLRRIELQASLEHNSVNEGAPASAAVNDTSVAVSSGNGGGGMLSFWLKQLASVLSLPLSAWVLFLLTGFWYVGVGVFTQVASDMLQHAGGDRALSPTAAGDYMSIPNLLALAGNPLAGYLLDKVGKALYLVTAACVMLLGSQVLFISYAQGWIDCNPVWLLLYQGCVYSLGAATLWPLLSFVVPKRDLGASYGMMTSAQNMFLGGFAVLVGVLQDWARHHKPQGDALQYTLPLMVFAACAFVALLLSLLLIVLDKRRHHGALNASADKRALRAAMDEADRVEARRRGTVTGHVGDEDDGAYEPPSMQHSEDASCVGVRVPPALVVSRASSEDGPEASPLGGVPVADVQAAARIHTPAALPAHAYDYKQLESAVGVDGNVL